MRPVSLRCTILACAFIHLFVHTDNKTPNRCTMVSHEAPKEVKRESAPRFEWDFCCDDTTYLRLCKLCAIKIKSDTIDATRIFTRRLLAQSAVIDTLCTNTAQIGLVRSNRVESVNLCANNGYVRNLCVDTISTTSLTLNNTELCTKLRAYANDIVTHTGAVGDALFFDNIVDDPNNNLTNTTYTSYTVPRTGYYIATASIGVKGLTGPIITGIPVSVIQFDVNGVTRAEDRNSFLGFSQTQNSAIAALLLLHAGDIVTVGYKILIQDPTAGEIKYPGTITVGGAADSNYFAIHYLSSMCVPTTSNGSCITCQPANLSPCVAAYQANWCDINS